MNILHLVPFQTLAVSALQWNKPFFVPKELLIILLHLLFEKKWGGGAGGDLLYWKKWDGWGRPLYKHWQMCCITVRPWNDPVFKCCTFHLFSCHIGKLCLSTSWSIQTKLKQRRKRTNSVLNMKKKNNEFTEGKEWLLVFNRKACICSCFAIKVYVSSANISGIKCPSWECQMFVLPYNNMDQSQLLADSLFSSSLEPKEKIILNAFWLPGANAQVRFFSFEFSWLMILIILWQTKTLH